MASHEACIKILSEQLGVTIEVAREKYWEIVRDSFSVPGASKEEIDASVAAYAVNPGFHEGNA